MTMTVYPAATARPLARMLLLHGAGASVHSSFFQQLIPLLCTAGLEIYAANFAYMEKTLTGQRQVAPKADKLLPELVEMVRQLQSAGSSIATADNLPLWLGGKSLGGRVIAMYLAGQSVDAAVMGGVVFGYPLCPPAKAKDAVKAAQVIAERSHCLHQLQRPLLICQGSRDGFGDATALQSAGAGQVMAGCVPAKIQPLALADHDFALPKIRPAGTAADAALVQAVDAVAEFIKSSQGQNWKCRPKDIIKNVI